MRLKDVLEESIAKLNQNQIEESNNKARRILAFILGVKKEYLIINDEQEITEEKLNKFNKYIDEIIAGNPIQYILGYQEFMGINFIVNENVLIPQPDTEVLVEKTIELAKEFNNPTILDLCTGSGAIAISIAKNVPDANIIASDISKEALDIAKQNDKDNKVSFVLSDMFENINDKFDIIVSNPPYIKTGIISTLSKEVQNEPHLALDGGNDGLDFYRIIINNAFNYLNPNGYLCLEIGDDQQSSILKLINNCRKYIDITCFNDLSLHNRVIICRSA